MLAEHEGSSVGFPDLEHHLFSRGLVVHLHLHNTVQNIFKEIGAGHPLQAIQVREFLTKNGIIFSLIIKRPQVHICAQYLSQALIG